MADLATSVPGVAGAQLAGAGLGGGMMILAHRDAAESVADELREVCYEPRSLEPEVSVCVPIAGSGVLLSDGAAAR